MGMPWTCHELAMEKPWACHGKAMGMPWIANLLDTANGRPAELIMEMGTLSLRKRGGREV